MKEELIYFAMNNLYYVVVVAIFIFLRKYLRQAILGVDGSLDFKELVKATVWFLVLCVGLRYLSGKDTEDINMNLLQSLLGYMFLVSGIDVVDKKIKGGDSNQ